MNDICHLLSMQAFAAEVQRQVNVAAMISWKTDIRKFLLLARNFAAASVPKLNSQAYALRKASINHHHRELIHKVYPLWREAFFIPCYKFKFNKGYCLSRHLFFSITKSSKFLWITLDSVRGCFWAATRAHSLLEGKWQHLASKNKKLPI